MSFLIVQTRLDKSIVPMHNKFSSFARIFKFYFIGDVDSSILVIMVYGDVIMSLQFVTNFPADRQFESCRASVSVSVKFHYSRLDGKFCFYLLETAVMNTSIECISVINGPFVFDIFKSIENNK